MSFVLLFFSLSIPFLFTGHAPGGSNARTSLDSSTAKAIDGYVVDRMRSTRIPGLALGIVRGDDVPFLKGYGRADPAGRPVTPQTPFVLGSITKPFTALAVMQLVDAGTVQLDAPVQRYIPWFRTADSAASARITVRQLLTMRSGLPQLYDTQLWRDQDDGALERVVRRLETVHLARPMGSFGYSNSNYETLGLIVQRVSGVSYEQYVTEHIFTPLAMRNSFASQNEAMRHGMATGHRWWFGVPIPFTPPYNRAELPAGYLIASAEDMTHFLIAQLNGGRYGGASILSPDAMALMHAPPASGTYGFGWEFVRANGRTLINHDGGTVNFQTSLLMDPEGRAGVFVAANVINALDTFSSPHGGSTLDGLTVREMARVVLSLATHQPLPSRGVGHERLTFVFDLTIAILTVWLAISLARVPRRYRRIERQGMLARSELRRRALTIAALNWTLPIVVLYLTIGPFSAVWKVLVEFQPDGGYWLETVAIVLFVKGLVELSVLRSLAQAEGEGGQGHGHHAGIR